MRGKAVALKEKYFKISVFLWVSYISGFNIIFNIIFLWFQSKLFFFVRSVRKFTSFNTLILLSHECSSIFVEFRPDFWMARPECAVGLQYKSFRHRSEIFPLPLFNVPSFSCQPSHQPSSKTHSEIYIQMNDTLSSSEALFW